jgi:hypothetical protein
MAGIGIDDVESRTDKYKIDFVGTFHAEMV